MRITNCEKNISLVKETDDICITNSIQNFQHNLDTHMPLMCKSIRHTSTYIYRYWDICTKLYQNYETAQENIIIDRKL